MALCLLIFLSLMIYPVKCNIQGKCDFFPLLSLVLRDILSVETSLFIFTVLHISLAGTLGLWEGDVWTTYLLNSNCMNK